MNKQNSTQAMNYTEQVRNFIRQVERWLDPIGLKGSEGSVELNEEDIGRYQAMQLEITDRDDKLIASLVPMGASIIGADGRIDLVGPLDREVILYLTGGGPQVQGMVR